MSQAEYQLFLDSLTPDECPAQRPPHWNADRFQGDPEAPILGIWPWQAQAYADFLRRTGSPGWRLPAQEDPVVLQDELAYWNCASELRFSHVPHSRDIQLPSELKQQGIFLESHDLMTFAHSISEAMWIADRGPPSQALSVAASLQLAIAISFAHEVNAAWDQARDMGFNLALVKELIGALSSSVKVWRQYGACLLRIPIRRFATQRRAELMRVGSTLDTLVRRESGQLQPYEGIQLVRGIQSP